jgi:hypothetical protein
MVCTHVVSPIEDTRFQIWITVAYSIDSITRKLWCYSLGFNVSRFTISGREPLPRLSGLRGDRRIGPNRIGDAGVIHHSHGFNVDLDKLAREAPEDTMPVSTGELVQ